jgi:hypothetical protein
VADLGLFLPLAFALFAPMALLGHGRPRVGRAVAGAFAPAVLVGVAALISSRTAWGQRVPAGEFTASNTVGLILFCVIFTLGGIAGMVLAGLSYLTGRIQLARRRRY